MGGILCWQHDLLALDNLCDVEIEEVTVENGLDDSSHNGDRVDVALIVISVDPVQNVKCSVRSLGKQIVRSDCFGFSGL